jgi:hypothetical protein
MSHTLPIQMRRRGLPVLGGKRWPGEGVEDVQKRLRAPYNAKGAEEWGWAFGTERGKGNVELGLDAVASHPWSGGCPNHVRFHTGVSWPPKWPPLTREKFVRITVVFSFICT